MTHLSLLQRVNSQTGQGKLWHGLRSYHALLHSSLPLQKWYSVTRELKHVIQSVWYWVSMRKCHEGNGRLVTHSIHAIFCAMTSRERKHVLENAFKKTPKNAYEHRRKGKHWIGWIRVTSSKKSELNWKERNHIGYNTQKLNSNN